jgi:2-polyprenyl-3-methyl-5-hydroxy-6-metoxy-1,4-benzoquinol methylase
MYKDIDLYKELHKTNSEYGATGFNYCNLINFYLEHYSNEIKTALDFGCGKGTLKQCIDFPIDEYDPAIEGKENISQNQYDLIITTDVLEHLYENEISLVCTEFMNLKPKRMLHFISTVEAKTILPDNTNAHKTVKHGEWWKNTISKYTNFNIHMTQYDKVAVLNCIYDSTK